jgi:hypothetical protein
MVTKVNTNPRFFRRNNAGFHGTGVVAWLLVAQAFYPEHSEGQPVGVGSGVIDLALTKPHGLEACAIVPVTPIHN